MEFLIMFFYLLAILNLILMLWFNIDDMIKRITRDKDMKQLANELEKTNKRIMELTMKEE